MSAKMEVKVYGAGCDKFFQTVRSFNTVLKKYDDASEVVEITDGKKIAVRGITNLPAVFINGKLILQGEGVSEERAKEILQTSV